MPSLHHLSQSPFLSPISVIWSKKYFFSTAQEIWEVPIHYYDEACHSFFIFSQVLMKNYGIPVLLGSTFLFQTNDVTLHLLYPFLKSSFSLTSQFKSNSYILSYSPILQIRNFLIYKTNFTLVLLQIRKNSSLSNWLVLRKQKVQCNFNVYVIGCFNMFTMLFNTSIGQGTSSWLR